MDSEKYLIFYSKYCSYSTELLKQIESKNLKDYFMFVCIDSNNLTIPKFVDRVPLLFIKSTKTVIVENDIVHFLNKLISVKDGGHTKEQDIECYMTKEMGNSFSDNFSFIDESNIQKKSFLFVNNQNAYNDAMNITRENTNQITNNSDNKIDSQAIEMYMMKRDSELNDVLRKQ